MKRSQWYKIQPYSPSKPSQRWGHSSCVVANDLIVFGGYADSNYMNDLWVFNTITLQWKIVQTFGNIPEARSNATLNYQKQLNKLILFGGGGQGKKRFNTIFVLDWQTKIWTQVSPNNYQQVPWERTYHISQIIEKYLVIFGGQNFADLNDLWLFDLQNNYWQQVQFSNQQLKPCPRRFHSSVLRNNELIIINGCHNKYRALKSVFKIDFTQFLKTKNMKSLQWQQVQIQCSDFIPRWGHTSTYNSQNDKIYIFGGRFSSDLQDLIYLDMDKKTSKKLSLLIQNSPSPRRRHSANFIGISLVIFGGFNGSYFNDTYNVNIPTQTTVKKYTKSEIINFSYLLTKNFEETTSFLQLFIKKFKNLHEYLRQKYTEKQIDKILTSIVRGFNVSSQKCFEQIENLKQKGYLQEKYHIFKNKAQKIDSIKSIYGNLLLKHQKKQLNQSFIYAKDAFFTSFNSKNNTEMVAEIVFLNSNDFELYLQNEKLQYLEKLNFIEKNNIPLQCDYYIEFNGQQKVNLDFSVKYTSPYFCNCLKSSKKISFEHFDMKNIRVFQVGIMYLTTQILVIPKNFTEDETKKLAQFSNYFCVSNLTKILQKFLIQKVTKDNVLSLSKFASAMNMKKLVKKCSLAIIQREEQNYFSRNSFNKKISPSIMHDFEMDFFSNPSNFIYSEQFQREITRQFDLNKLNILLKNIQKLKDIGNTKKSKIQETQNQEKQNEENLLNHRF